MSDPIGRLVPGLDPIAGTFALPLWAAGAFAALLAVFCILAFSRAGREGMVGGLARVALVLTGATLALFGFEAASHQSRNAERLALDSRLSELTARTAMPGSALACLDAIAGDAVEGHCEKALFATPQGMAAAVSYVAAQLALLADTADFASRGNPGYEPALARLRRAVESDRFGLVAQVLARQDNCTPDQCSVFVLLTDTTRISANLASRTYDSYVQRHATVWPAIAPSPVANLPGAAPSFAALPPLPPGTSGYTPRLPGPNVFFPSSESIPAVSIMTSEPAAENETTGSAAPPAARRPPATPPKRPAQAAPPAPAPQSSAPPMDLNTAARTGTPPATTPQ
jgi:hypothetical protein